jgi:hypothetical protein
MKGEFVDPRVNLAILIGPVLLSIVASGLSLMLGLRRISARSFLIGIFLAAAAAIIFGATAY